MMEVYLLLPDVHKCVYTLSNVIYAFSSLVSPLLQALHVIPNSLFYLAIHNNNIVSHPNSFSQRKEPGNMGRGAVYFRQVIIHVIFIGYITFLQNPGHVHVQRQWGNLQPQQKQQNGSADIGYFHLRTSILTLQYPLSKFCSLKTRAVLLNYMAVLWLMTVTQHQLLP